MENFTYSDLLEHRQIWIGTSFYFQSASKNLFQEFGKYEIKGLGDFIIKGRMNEKTNKKELQFFIKLENPEKYNEEKFRVEFKNDEQKEFNTVDIDFFNGDSIMSDVIDDFDYTKVLISGHLSIL